MVHINFCHGKSRHHHCIGLIILEASLRLFFKTWSLFHIRKPLTWSIKKQCMIFAAFLIFPNEFIERKDKEISRFILTSHIRLWRHLYIPSCVLKFTMSNEFAIFQWSKQFEFELSDVTLHYLTSLFYDVTHTHHLVSQRLPLHPGPSWPSVFWWPWTWAWWRHMKVTLRSREGHMRSQEHWFSVVRAYHCKDLK